MKRLAINRRLVWLLSCALLVVSGCGEEYPSGTVQGRVTVDGQPLETGTIHFTPLEGGGGSTISVDIGENGQYRAEKVAIGKNRAVFLAIKETGKMLRDKDMGIDYPETVSLIAPKYHLQGIEVDVVSGTTEQNFELTSE